MVGVVLSSLFRHWTQLTSIILANIEKEYLINGIVLG